MQLDNQLALAFGLVTTLLTLVGLVTKSAIIYQIHRCRQALQSSSSSSTSFPQVAIDLERQTPAVTMGVDAESRIDECSARATQDAHSRRSSTSLVTTAPSNNCIVSSATRVNQADHITVEHTGKSNEVLPNQVSALTDGKLATHNDTTSRAIVDQSHVESCLEQQTKLNRRHARPDSEAWQELCQEDELAAEIEELVRASGRREE